MCIIICILLQFFNTFLATNSFAFFKFNPEDKPIRRHKIYRLWTWSKTKPQLCESHTLSNKASVLSLTSIVTEKVIAYSIPWWDCVSIYKKKIFLTMKQNDHLRPLIFNWVEKGEIIPDNTAANSYLALFVENYYLTLSTNLETRKLRQKK